MTRPAKLRSSRSFLIFGFLALATLVGGFGYWSASTLISGAVVASGRVEVDKQRQVVQHLDGGIVESIHVDEGDHVAAGKILIRLDSSILSSSLEIADNQWREYTARLDRLEAERDSLDEVVFSRSLTEFAETDPDLADQLLGQRNLFKARRVSLDREIEQLRRRQDQMNDQIEGVDAQVAALALQLELILQELAAQQTLLDKGLAQSTRVLALQREEAQLIGRVGELKSSRSQIEGRITEIDIGIEKLWATRREEAISLMRDIQFRQFEVAEQRRSLEQQMDRLDIAAPASGVVYGLQVFAPRSVIRPADPVLFIVPQDKPMVVAAQVPPIHVDQVYPGQEVILRFSSFDQRSTPELFGIVDNLSADAFEDQITGASYFRVEISLREGEINKLPDGQVLIPGMPVESYLRTADRTPLAYLLKPLTDYFVKAFREG